MKKLHPYQTEPVERFIERGNLLVAYQVGLGKTIIGIAAAEELLAAGKIKCCLIVCPASLKYQWAQKIAEFTDLAPMEKKVKDSVITIPRDECFILDGSPKYRDYTYSLITSGKSRPRYVIMSYDSVLNDAHQVRKIKPGMVILDEITAIKSFKAKRSKKIKQMLDAPYRMGLTGTPVENRPDELYSIMQWVDAEALGRYDLFEKAYVRRNRYGWVVAYKNLPVLRKRLGPAMSRKSSEDADVKPYLPEVETLLWTVPMPHETVKVYKHIASDMLEELGKVDKYSGFDVHSYYQGVDESTPSGKLMAMHMCLEMLLDHPDLIIFSAKDYKTGNGGSKYAYHLWQAGLLDSVLDSAKLDHLDYKVKEILNFGGKSKILIFSFFRNMLDIIEEKLDVPCVQFHGGMSATAKSAVVSKFSGDSDCRVFLSSHAGAYGMDMSMANYLVNFDHPWAAGKADQINGRHVRASSEFGKVFIANMAVEGSVEERKLRLLERKRRIASAILDGHGSDDFGRVAIDVDTLTEHLTSLADRSILTIHEG